MATNQLSARYIQRTQIGIGQAQDTLEENASWLDAPAARDRLVLYRELAVANGHKVSVDAWVAPAKDADAIEAMGYRGATSTTRRSIARPELGPIEVEDRSLETL